MVAGLTGGIGSGKSTVCSLFELLGCAVFKSDDVAREVYFDKEIRMRVIKLLGNEAYLTDSLLNKNYISSKIFSNAELLRQLNAIIHPAVLTRTKAFKAQHKEKIIIKETALLFEAGIEKEVDRIIVVAADQELRLRRVMLRDKLEKEIILKKMNSQLSQDEKIKKADFVIYNTEEQLLIPQVIKVHKTLMELQNA